MASLTDRSPADINVSAGDDIVHYVLDTKPDIALCGKDVSTRPFTDKLADCLVCIELFDLYLQDLWEPRW